MFEWFKHNLSEKRKETTVYNSGTRKETTFFKRGYFKKRKRKRERKVVSTISAQRCVRGHWMQQA